MMPQTPPELTSKLSSVGLPEWRYYPVTTSTNDLALVWAGEGAVDFSLVIADAQTAGRGRENRQWVTQPGAALAFSLILRPTGEELSCLPRFTALAALSLLAVMDEYDLQGCLKWPNDVLLSRKKVAGILVEADWQEDRLTALVVGMGVNITPAAIPPAEKLRYPATSIETEIGRKIDRWAILASILHTLQHYRDRLPTSAFIHLWNERLAFKNEIIRFRFPNGNVSALKVIRVQSDGCLVLRTRQGEILKAVAGEIKLAGRDDESKCKAD